MAAPLPRPRAVAVPRAALLVGLLLLTVAVAGSLAYEAHDAAQSHRVTAERALRDYASVAAWEYVANAQERFDRAAYGALSPLTSGRASSPYELLAPPTLLAASVGETLGCDAARGDSARVTFRIDLRDGALAVDGASGSARFLSWLRDTVVAHTRLRYRPEMRFAVLADAARAPGRIVLYAVRYAQHGAPLAAYGFTTCPRAIVDRVLRPVIAEHQLLPGSVSGGARNDSLLVVSVIDAGGRSWLPSAGEAESAYVDAAALDGLGIPLTVRASLRAGAPEWLLVGRPPRSRLPILVGLFGLTAALAVVALMQLRREHELARLRADFTSSVSHELRTPLAQILLFGETLKLGRVRSDDDRRVAVDTIVQEARRLMHLVDNVLHFARTSEGRMQVDPTPSHLGPLVGSIVETFAPLAEERGASLVTAIDDDLVVMVDPGALRQIVLNLLDNALKYGPRGQTVRVSVRRHGDMARLAVDDQGGGIPPADRERIWNPYVRLERDRNAAHGGSGLGLAVVRELTRLHRGMTRVEDCDGGGASFVVDLPCVDAPEPSAGGRPIAVAGSSRGKVAGRSGAGSRIGAG